MNGMIIVIFIILYFAFRFLKAKDSQEDSGRYSKRPYDTGYQWNRGVPPEEDVPESFEDEGVYEDKAYEAEGKDESESYKAEGDDEGESYEAEGEDESESYDAGCYGFEGTGNNGEGEAEATEYVENAAKVKPLEVNTDYQMPEVPAPEAIGLTMPEPMSMPEMKIVIDSEVHVDTTMLQDKDK